MDPGLRLDMRAKLVEALTKLFLAERWPAIAWHLHADFTGRVDSRLEPSLMGEIV